MSRPTSLVEHLEAALDADDPLFHVRQALQYAYNRDALEADCECITVEWRDTTERLRMRLEPPTGGNPYWERIQERHTGLAWVPFGREQVSRVSVDARGVLE